MKTCPDCDGDGVVDKGTDDEQRCPTCGGSGFVPDNHDDDDVLNASRQRSRASTRPRGRQGEVS
jgi:DnaJ-class molecular chaperone